MEGRQALAFGKPVLLLNGDSHAFTDDRPLHERIHARKETTAGAGPLDEAPSSPGITGGDRRADYPSD